MIRETIRFVAGFVFLVLGIRSLTFPDIGYVLTAGYLLTGVALLAHAWILRKSGRGSIPLTIVLVIGCALIVVGNILRASS